MNDIFDKLNKFESALIAAWCYDTRLDYQESEVSGIQAKKSDEHHKKARQLKEELIAAIMENNNA